MNNNIKDLVSLGIMAAIIGFAGRAGYKAALQTFGAPASQDPKYLNNTPTEVSPWSEPEGTVYVITPEGGEVPVVRNWGTVERIAPDRALIAGQAVGQTINLAPTNPDSVADAHNAYSATLMMSVPTFAQNYSGRAVGTE